MLRTHRINKAQLVRGIRAESKEHPWASKRMAARIASDHISENARSYPIKKRK